MTAKNYSSLQRPAFPESNFTYNPLMHVRVLFVRFLQGLFGAAPQNTFKWAEDATQTEIVITDEDVIKPDAIERKPAITITRGPIAFQPMGHDDLDSYDMQTGSKTKGILIPGTITMNCISRTSLESEHLAFIVAEHLWLLKEVLLEQGFYHLATDLTIGSPSPAGSLVASEGGDEFVVTAVTVPYQFPRLSSFTPLGRAIINSIKVRVALKKREVVPRTMGAFPSFEGEHTQLSELTPPAPFSSASDVPLRADGVRTNPMNPAQSVQLITLAPAPRGLPGAGVGVPLGRPRG